MRGDDRQPDAVFSYVSTGSRIPQDHPRLHLPETGIDQGPHGAEAGHRPMTLAIPPWTFTASSGATPPTLRRPTRTLGSIARGGGGIPDERTDGARFAPPTAGEGGSAPNDDRP